MDNYELQSPYCPSTNSGYGQVIVGNFFQYIYIKEILKR